MNKLIISVVLFALLTTLSATPVNAQAKIAGMSAMSVTPVKVVKVDTRAKALRAYLLDNNSPFADSAETFVKSADTYNIDWKLVAAIAGLESGFGKHIPYQSNNAWGWGVYGDNVIRFASWDEGIETISKGIRVRYMDERGAANVYEIGSTYASSPTWGVRVEMFMNKIDAYHKKFETQDTATALSLTI